jgi:hypothetical protein
MPVREHEVRSHTEDGSPRTFLLDHTQQLLSPDCRSERAALMSAIEHRHSSYGNDPAALGLGNDVPPVIHAALLFAQGKTKTPPACFEYGSISLNASLCEKNEVGCTNLPRGITLPGIKKYVGRVTTNMSCYGLL